MLFKNDIKKHNHCTWLASLRTELRIPEFEVFVLLTFSNVIGFLTDSDTFSVRARLRLKV